MKPLLALLASALLGMCIAACGSSSTSTAAKDASTTSGSGSVKSSGSPIRKKDRDNDEDNNDDDQHVLDFGQTADAADSQGITMLVKRYYAAAATSNGTKGCSLLASFVAESVAEEDGHNPGLRGTTCATVLSKLFREHHQELVSKNATLKLMRIGVEGDKSLVALEFPAIPEVRQITARLNNGRWTMLTLLDGILE